MRQVLHLLIVDRGRRAALAGRWGSRWLLPVIACGERTRAALVAARWCAGRGLSADVAGQWLGRIGSDAADWLLAMRLTPGHPTAAPPLVWISLDELSSGTSVVDYQTWALARTLDRGPDPSVCGPFGNLDWPDWIRRWIGESVDAPPRAWTPYRISPHDIVLGADTACGRVYFKGLAADRAAEAAITRMLAAVTPDCFARTLALESRADGSVWWLTAACAGRPPADADAAASALGRIQRETATAIPRGSLPGLDVAMASRWAGNFVADSETRAAIRRACTVVMSAAVPRTWVPMDLDPTNVLTDDAGAVRFIDVDESYVGPAPLAMAGLGRRYRETAAYTAYERTWHPTLTDLDWRSFEIEAEVLHAWLGWRRLKRNIERGEVYASLDLAALRVGGRLATAIYRR